MFYKEISGFFTSNFVFWICLVVCRRFLNIQNNIIRDNNTGKLLFQKLDAIIAFTFVRKTSALVGGGGAFMVVFLFIAFDS